MTVGVDSGNKPPALFVLGPTATGKTDLAAALLDHVPGEIISVDSALVYRGMDIGSAKPDAALLARAPHHLLDIRDPSEPYSAAEFAADATALMADIVRRGRVPILVGGTMLYFKVLLEGLDNLPASDMVVREEILAQAAQQGWPALHRQLAAVDPDTAAQLHPNHSQRIQRALEIYRLTGRPASELKGQAAPGSEGAVRAIAGDYHITQLALIPQDRALLHRRIAQRFQRMLEQGFELEVRELRNRGDLHPDLPAIRAVGYRQMWEFLDGDVSWEAMVERGVAATRQLAKRQLTWLRKWQGLELLTIDDPAGTALSVQKLLENSLKILEKGPIYNLAGK